MSLDDVAKQLFFIVGCGRSGTSLLQAMLTSHPGTVLPNETGFYTLVKPACGRKFDNLPDRATYERACHAALHHWRTEALDLDPETTTALCHTGEPSWDTIFLAILASFAGKHGARRIGEKSPGHVEHIAHLSAVYPQAKFIHMLRDPRAVVNSNLRVHFGSRFVAPLCRRWKRAIHAHQNHAERLSPERYLVVRYEELVRRPSEILQGVCRFLDMEFSTSMLEHDKRSVRGFADWQSGHMSNTMKPVFDSSIDKWQKELSGRRIALVEAALKHEMTLMNYPLLGRRTLLPALQNAMGQSCFAVERLLKRLQPPPSKRKSLSEAPAG